MTTGTPVDGTDRLTMPLLWAQRGHWTMYRQLPPEARHRSNEQVTVPLPAGITVDQATGAVRALVAKHQMFRTIYRTGATGRAEQIVLPTTEPAITISPMDSGEDDETAHRDLVIRLRRRGADVGETPPVRFGLLVRDGTARVLVVVVHHIAIDAAAFAAVRKDLAAILADADAAGAGRGLPLRVTPSAQVAFQQSGKGRRQHERTMDYWRRVVDRYPATVLPVTGGSPVRQRTRTATLDAAAAPVTRDLARRYAAPESIVVLAAVLAVLSRCTGNRRTAVSVSAANRFEPELVNFVGNLAQEVVVECAAPGPASMREFVGAVKRESLPVYRHGGFDSDEVFTLLRRREFTDGALLKRAVCYNYKDRSAYANARPPAGSETGTVTVTESRMPYYYSFGIGVHRLGERLVLLAHYDSPLFADDFATAVLTGVDKLLTSAAGTGDDPAVAQLLDDLAVPAPVSGGRWISRDGCRVSLDAVEGMLCSHPAVRGAHVVCRETATGDAASLVSYVAAAATDPFDLRRHASAQLPYWPAAVVPDEFIVVDRIADGAQAWSRLPVVVAGDGRTGPVFDQDPPCARALGRALAAVHPGVDWSRAPSYLTGGGDIGHIDAVLKALADHGATGLSYRDLYRVIPPGELAREIRLGSGAVQ